METIGESLKQFWLQQGIKLKLGASEIELFAFENKYNVRLPEDLKDYFSTVNGFDDSDVDGEYITFLPLEEIEPLSINWSQAAEAKSYFIFADYSISCHVYAIKLTEDTKFDNPIFIDFNDNKSPTQIADSFSEFAQSYIKNDYKVLFP
jgi:hypothetical protein